MTNIEYAIKLAASLYYEVCKTTRYRVSKKVALDRMRASVEHERNPEIVRFGDEAKR